MHSHGIFSSFVTFYLISFSFFFSVTVTDQQWLQSATWRFRPATTPGLASRCLPSRNTRGALATWTMEVTDPQHAGCDPQHGEKAHLILSSTARILRKSEPLILGFLGTRGHQILPPFQFRPVLLSSRPLLSSLSHTFSTRDPFS